MIDFRQEAGGPYPAPFSRIVVDGSVTLRSYDEYGKELQDYLIDYTGKGYNAARETHCLVPLSASVTLVCLLTQAATFRAFDRAGRQVGSDQAFGIGEPTVTLDGGKIVKVEIVAPDGGVFISTLAWVTQPESSGKKRDARVRGAA